MKKRRVFSRDFKLAAVKKVVAKGLSVTEVARDRSLRLTSHAKSSNKQSPPASRIFGFKLERKIHNLASLLAELASTLLMTGAVCWLLALKERKPLNEAAFRWRIVVFLSNGRSLCSKREFWLFYFRQLQRTVAIGAEERKAISVSLAVSG
jgi:Transposase